MMSSFLDCVTYEENTNSTTVFFRIHITVTKRPLDKWLFRHKFEEDNAIIY